MAKPPVNWNNVSMLTPGLKNLGMQFNERWPNRYGDSDGAIGDYAHSQGTSGHNPDDTSHDNAEWDSDSDGKSEVRAIDVDCDLNDPTITTSSDKQAQMQKVIDHMRELDNLDTVIRYMIFDGKIYKASNNFNPEKYTGSNSHSEHAHFSGAYSQSSDENKTFDYRFEEVGSMAVTDEDAAKIAKANWNYQMGDPETGNATTSSAGWWQRSSMQRAHETQEVVKEETAILAAKVDVLSAQVEALTGLIESHISGLIESNNR